MCFKFKKNIKNVFLHLCSLPFLAYDRPSKTPKIPPIWVWNPALAKIEFGALQPEHVRQF